MKLFRNKAARYAVIGLTVIFVLITGLGFVILCYSNDATKQAMIRQNLALVGGMTTGKPPSQLSVITGLENAADIAAGRAYLRPYSYDEDMPSAVSRYYQRLLNAQLITFAALAVLLYLTALSVLLFILSRVYGSLRELTQAAACAEFTGDDLASYGEGDLAALHHAVKALAARTDYSIAGLNQDKNYLKNLLSDISHQLKTPLSALRMYHDILLSKPNLEEEKRVEFLTRSQHQIDRTDWLIQGLLKMARVEAGAVTMNRRDCYLIDTVEQAATPFWEQLRQKGVALHTDVSPDILFTYDNDWVAEAIGNIIKNAMEHTPKGGQITIGASQTPLSVTLTITDNGEGMGTDEIPHIFERFYRTSSGTSVGSAGIGLSLAKEILEKNGADIYVKSDKGMGSEFTVTFLKKL